MDLKDRQLLDRCASLFTSDLDRTEIIPMLLECGVLRAVQLEELRVINQLFAK